MSNFILNNVLIVDNGKCSDKENPELVIKCETTELESLCNSMDIEILNNRCEDLHLLLKLSGPIPILEEIDIHSYYLFSIKPSSKNKVRVLEIEQLDRKYTDESQEDNNVVEDDNIQKEREVVENKSGYDTETSSESDITEEDFPEPDHIDKIIMKKELVEKLEYHINSQKRMLKQLKTMVKEISDNDFVDIKTLNTIDNNLNELFEKNNILHYK
jgi:hypothetical protein